MNFFKTILAALAFTASFTGCDMSDFGDINYSPNSPSEAYTSMLFLGAARYVPNFIMNSDSYDPWTQMWPGYIAPAMNDQFNTLQTTTLYGTRDYYLYPIKSLTQIIEMNENEETKNLVSVSSFGSSANQIAAAITLRAFFYMTLTDIVGALPYSEAYKGETEGNWLPKFDSHESIYAALDADLQTAYNMIDVSGSLTAEDIFFNGNMGKWKKFNATLRMMMAIKMSDVDPSNGRSRFAKAYSDGAMEDNSDSFSYTFDASGLGYATLYYVGNMNYANANMRFGPNAAIVDALKEHKDNRMFSYFTLNGYLGERDGDPTDFEAYIGIPYGLLSNTAVTNAKNMSCSVTQRFCQQTATYGVITATRTLLVEAEAAELGWINADPKKLYEKAIRLSFEDLGADGVDDYLKSEKVALSSDKDTAIKQIVMQRFLAGFMTDGIEAWADWRRHNVPELEVGENPKTVGITKFPYRMQYNTTDIDYNSENANAAINTYLGGKDDRWTRLWWDVADN